MDRLTEAIERIDLPTVVAELWPESGARPGRAGPCRAVWRGDRHPSLSLFKAREAWLWKDHATGESGNAFHLLLKAGLSKRQAAELLKAKAGVDDSGQQPAVAVHRTADPPSSGLHPKEQRALKAAQARLDTSVIRDRGIRLDQARKVGLGKSPQGDLVIPILGPNGEVQAVKVRLRRPLAGARYRYLTPGRGAPAWYSPGFGRYPKRPVLVVEGELNAIVAWFALHQDGTGQARCDVLGIPGVEGAVPWERLKGRRVYLCADEDAAGRAALERWAREAEAAGVVASALRPIGGNLDACEYAARWGQRALGERLGALLRAIPMPPKRGTIPFGTGNARAPAGTIPFGTGNACAPG